MWVCSRCYKKLQHRRGARMAPGAAPHPVVVELSASDTALARKYARGAELGGQSQVRGSDRGERLAEDQLVGQLCTLAFHRHQLGHLDLYIASREAANAEPWRGDGGTDVPGKHIDVKGSAMRASDDPLRYRLPVRPKERHSANRYVLALLPREPTKVYLVGWAKDSDLPEEPDRSGPLAGAFTIQAYALRDMTTMRVEASDGREL